MNPNNPHDRPALEETREAASRRAVSLRVLTATAEARCRRRSYQQAGGHRGSSFAALPVCRVTGQPVLGADLNRSEIWEANDFNGFKAP